MGQARRGRLTGRNANEGTAEVYLAVIGDIVGSREVEDRRGLQHLLRAGIEQINLDFSAILASQFILTIGDEFQGLLAKVGRVDGLMGRIRSVVHPIELRFGLGIGELDTPVEEVALGMDGPCFHRARRALERAEEAGTRVEVEAGGHQISFAIYSLLYTAMRTGWTDRQRQVVDLASSGDSGKRIAGQLGITPSAVSQHLRAAEADAIFSATQLWLRALEQAFQRARS
jgi:hypothetical protein